MNKLHQKSALSLLAILVAGAVVISTNSGNARAKTLIEQTETAQEQLSETATRVDEQLQSSSNYAGVSIDDSGRLHVYTTSPATNAVRPRAINTTDTQNVVYHQVRYTAKQLEAVQTKILNDASSLKNHGIDIVSVFPVPELSSLEVGVDTPRATTEQVLKQRYGEMVRVTNKRRSPQTASRAEDGSLWSGGNVIVSDSGEGCTLGPAITTSSGQHVSLTAGHCFLNTPHNNMTPFMYAVHNGPYGAHAAAELDNEGYDVAIVNRISSGQIWQTASTDQQVLYGRTRQVAVQKSVPGLRVCVSGGFSGENCGARVYAVDGAILTEGGTVVMHAVSASHPSVPIVRRGDSGAPVYIPHGSGLFVTGVLTNGDTTFDPGDFSIHCPEDYNTFCGDTIVYQDMSSVLLHLHASLYVPKQ